jgi:hypothetical protein
MSGFDEAMKNGNKKFVLWAVGLVIAGLLTFIGGKFIPDAISAMVDKKIETKVDSGKTEIIIQVQALKTSIDENLAEDNKVHHNLDKRVEILEERLKKIDEVNRDVKNVMKEISDIKTLLIEIVNAQNRD